MVVNGVHVIADPRLNQEEIIVMVMEEKNLWESQNKILGQIELRLEQDEVVIRAAEKSPIRRIRRITGYLSAIDNFNDAKVAECADRTKHQLL
jgi:anaerobic ribonucleoside-triphosphate reductase activating protein